jgi:hypothetical protein
MTNKVGIRGTGNGETQDHECQEFNNWIEGGYADLTLAAFSLQKAVGCNGHKIVPGKGVIAVWTYGTRNDVGSSYESVSKNIQERSPAQERYTDHKVQEYIDIH